MGKMKMKEGQWMSMQTPLLLGMLLSAAGVMHCRAEDDLVPRLGCYGDKWVKSPHIDRLASQGTTFLHAQTQYPVCGPSRASLMSGLRPESTGVLDLKTKWREANPTIVSLPQHLKEHGYFTTGTGKVYDYRCVDDPEIMDAESWSEPFSFKPGLSSADVEQKGKDGRGDLNCAA